LEARRNIGYLPELYRYQEWLSGEEVLRLHARLCGRKSSGEEKRISQLLDEVGIGLRGKDRVKHYSKGMQQRLGLACALISDPPLLFLDEPSSAMDPVGRMEVRVLLNKLKAEGKTIFLNSHLLEDVEMLCDRVALLNNGAILQSGTVTEVLQEKKRWQHRIGGFEFSMLGWLRQTTGLSLEVDPESGPETADGSVWLQADIETDEQIGWLNYLIMEQGMTLYEVKKAKGKLDEWFVSAVAGRSHRGERE
jgi:ABC-2 type transport system ATP-binding protein